MTSKVTCSSKRNPCPVCGRTKDGDCRQTAEGLVFCHGNTDHRAGAAWQGDDGKSWAFTGVSKDGRCGIFKPDEPLAPRTPLSPITPIPVTAAAAPGGQQTWVYSATQRVLRTPTPKGKRFTPEHLVGGVWQAGAGADAWPLYGQVAPVSVETEGEKCTDICLSLGIPAISQPGHNHTNDAIYARYQSIKHIVQHIIYISDNDETGRQKAEKCSEQAKRVGIPFTHLPATQLYSDTPPAGSVDDFPPDTLNNLPALINDALAQPQPQSTPAVSQGPAAEAFTRDLRVFTAQGLSGASLDAKAIELAHEYEISSYDASQIKKQLLLEYNVQAQADAEAELITQGLTLQVIRKTFTLERILTPGKLADSARIVTRGLASDDLSTAMTLLAMTAGVTPLGTSIRGNYSTFVVPPCIYFALVKDSGGQKSGILKALIETPLKPIYRRLIQEHQQAMKVWLDANQHLPKAQRDPEPDELQLWVNGYTAEAADTQLAIQESRGKGLLIQNDELSRVFESIDCYAGKGKRGIGEAQLLRIFDGSGTNELRVKGGRRYTACQITVAGGVQDSVFAQMARDGDPYGTYARMLLCPLPDPDPNRPFVVPTPEQLIETHQAELYLQQFAEAIYNSSPQQLELSPGAMAAFHTMCLQSERRWVASDPGSPHKAIHGKRSGYILRIAGLLHLVRIYQNIEQLNSHIPTTTLNLARDLVDHLQEYAIRAHRNIAAQAQDVIPDLGDRILKYAANAGSKGISAGEIYRKYLTPKQRKEYPTELIGNYFYSLQSAGHAVVDESGKVPRLKLRQN